jgi:UDP-N-acetylglucosamine 4,6-dehydratase
VRKFIGDVRDRDRLRRAMDGCDVVIHAAALKRIEVGQYNPDEMVKTNVIGTMNVIEAAQDARVSRVLYIGTDKAWRPVSPYGHSKALAEQLILAANNMVPRERWLRFSVVRYGNVAGSTGSVIPTWRTATGRVRLTDPDATRFWMSIDEAVKLVADTVATMQGGELVIPVLPAFRLGDLAEAMGVEYDTVGLPRWEKLHEGMDDDNLSNEARRMSVHEIRERLCAMPTA